MSESEPERVPPWTRGQQRYAQRYVEVCREVHRLVPAEDAWTLLRAYGPLAKTSVAQVERAWAREKHRRGLS